VYQEADMERIQILLEPQERQMLKELANEAGTSMSDIVRDLLRQRMQEQRRANMRRAAELMANEYRTNAELTELTDAVFDEETGDVSQ
jgi:hypothetical protein